MYLGTPRKWKEKEREQRSEEAWVSIKIRVRSCHNAANNRRTKSETMERHQTREGRELNRWLHDAHGGGKSRRTTSSPKAFWLLHQIIPPLDLVGLIKARRLLGIATLNALEYWQA